tara:strand:- start:293 stop:808 length:516 start_codon:yes stop_codon:yes gene_type:complete
MKREVNYSNWREDLREVVDVPPIEPKTPKTPRREVKETEKVNNKVVINPTMSEANEVFKEIGGTVLEVMDMKKADMGEVIDDFKKSDAPQFKGKSKEKRREMAIAAKLQANEETAFDRVKKSMGKSFIDTKAPKKEMSPEDKKKEAKRRYNNYLANTKKDDPYRSRPGESD